MCRPSCAVACCTVLFLVIVARYAWAEQNPYLPKNISVTSIQAVPVQPTGRPILLTVVLGNTTDKPAYYWVGPTPYPTVTDVKATITDEAAQRLRQRYRDIFREQIAATVDSQEAVEDEIRSLFAVLSS